MFYNPRKFQVIALVASIAISPNLSALELVDYKGLFKPKNTQEIYSTVNVHCAIGKVHATLIGDKKINVAYASASSTFNVRGERDGDKVTVDRAKDNRSVESSFEGTIDGDTITGVGWQSVSRGHDWYRIFGDKKVCNGTFFLKKVEVMR